MTLLWLEASFLLDFLFQNTPIITGEKLTVKSANALEDIVFTVSFEIVKFLVWL